MGRGGGNGEGEEANGEVEEGLGRGGGNVPKTLRSSSEW